MKSMLQYYFNIRSWILMIVIILCASIHVNAQYEPMFTQYMYNETFINPAYVGSHDCVSMTLLNRNQWVGIDGAPKTQTFSIHGPVSHRKLGIGLSVMNENIGVTHQFSVYTNIAYRILFRKAALSFGLQEGFVNDEERLTDVHTTTQGDNQFAYDTRKLFLPNAGFGIYFNKENFYAGISVPRLIENIIQPSQYNANVTNVCNLKYWHYYFTTGYVFNLNSDLKFKPSIMVKAVQNAPIQMDIGANFLFNEFLWIGGSYRTGDAATAMLGFQISQQLRIGYSYDYTLTDLQKYNSGTHEITVGYDFSFNKNKIISSRYF